MPQRLTHKAMYEKFVETKPVTPELEQEVLEHLREVKKEGTRTEPRLSATVRSMYRTHLDENAKKATSLIARMTEDNSQEWLDELFEAVELYLRFEKEGAEPAE